MLRIPLLPLVPIAALLWWLAPHPRFKSRWGLCTACGYDLRATPAAGGALLAVCPECGKETHAGHKPSPPPSR
jgi:hypothetical protein